MEPWIERFLVLGRVVGLENVPEELLGLPWGTDFPGIGFKVTE